MRTRAAILSTLTGVAGLSIALAPSGCGWIFGSCPNGEDFDNTYDITAQQLELLVQNGYSPGGSGGLFEDGGEGLTDVSSTADSGSSTGDGDGDGDGDGTSGTGGTGDTGDTGDTGSGAAYDSAEDVPCDVICKSKVNSGGFDSISVSSCTHDISAYEMGTSAGTEVVGTVTCSGTRTPECIGGRRPLGHVEPTLAPQDSTTRWLIGGAHLEAASVTAFEQLADDLARWGAPTELIGRCRDAAQDERDHARLMTTLAEARGAIVPPLEVLDQSRGLFETALHNAVEGCVTETWSALLACHQAACAEDAELRRVYAKIAIDETRHAELSWDLHVWLVAQLSEAERNQVERARRDALAQLPALARSQAQRRSAELGLPGTSRAVALATELTARLAA
jgi:hypothetical protein